jgi:hypothetical protein
MNLAFWPASSDVTLVVTLKADNRSRIKLPDIEPGQTFVFERKGNGVFLLREIRRDEDEKPLVKLARRPDGSYRFPNGVKLSKNDIAASIRADRDAR